MAGFRIFGSAATLDTVKKERRRDAQLVDSLLGRFHTSGAIEPITLADANAELNSVYYSSTQSKLVYKDASGTVNNLY